MYGGDGETALGRLKITACYVLLKMSEDSIKTSSPYLPCNDILVKGTEGKTNENE